MCGIVGICSPNGIPDRSLLLRMRDSMTHRGPDDEGSWWSSDAAVGLGHRRLSILDLSSAGHQPMMEGHGKLQIVFNGEIYNHRELRAELESLGHSFFSHSDTEVLLKAYRQWGNDCVLHLNGAFAFAIYDDENSMLFLARDRAGEKPLFYAQYADRFLFASELKALMADRTMPRKIDPEALEFYLAYGYVPRERCLLAGVRKLPPAHALSFCLRSKSVKVWSYWQLPTPQLDPAVTVDDLTDSLHRLLEDAVRRQMVADVPVGVLLSGGLDSSLITALASRVSQGKVKTFTITFPGHKGHDEGPYARIVADHFGTEHTELAAPPETVDLLPQLAAQYDEPIGDSSMVPTFLVAKLIRQHCTVALGGDGGDELFGGYPSYQWLFKHALARKWIPGLLRSGVSAVARHCLPVGRQGRTVLIGCAGDLPQAFAHFNLFFDVKSRGDLVPLLKRLGTHGYGRPEAFRARLCNPVRGMPGMGMAADFLSYLPEDILVKVDRASMLNSLEVRAPFLDQHVIEFAFGRVPNELRANSTERKILLRKLAERLLPSALDLRRKQGFSIPLEEWIRGDWGSFMHDVLTDGQDGLLAPRAVEQLWRGQQNGLKNTQRIFALVMLKLWAKKYQVSMA